MRHKSAVDLVKKIRNFINDLIVMEYHEDFSKLVKSFFQEIIYEIKIHPIWKDATPEEIDHAKEGIEKYVMTKLFNKYEICGNFTKKSECFVQRQKIND